MKTHLAAWLASLVCLQIGVAANGETISNAKALATPATATIEFFEGDAIETTIELVSSLPGEQGNGLAITLVEATGIGSTPVVYGTFNTGYTVGLDDAAATTYSTIASTLGSTIAEILTASVQLSPAGIYDPLLQDPPPTTVLTGGSNGTVPEPTTIALLALGGLAWPRRTTRRVPPTLGLANLPRTNATLRTTARWRITL